MIPALSATATRWLVGVLMVAGVGGWAGWSLRDAAAAKTEARLRRELIAVIEQASTDMARARQSIAALEDAVRRQNDEILRLNAAYDASRRQQAVAERRLREYLARPTPTPPVLTGTCEEMVEQVRQAAMEGR